MLKKIILLIIIIPTLAISENNLKIGVLSGLSGAAAKWNKFQNMGITLAKEEFSNEDLNLEIIFEDSATNTTKAISAFNKLNDFNKVDAIIANDYGFVIEPLLPLAKRKKKLLLAISMPLQRYCDEGKGYFFSATSQFLDSKEAFNKFIKLNPSVKKIAIFIFDDPNWGNTYRKIWTEIAKENNLEIVFTYKSSELTPDFKSPVVKMLRNKPDVIFIAHNTELFLKAIQPFNFKGQIVSANNIYEIISDSNRQKKLIEGVYLADPLISNKFRQKFINRFNLEPILEAYAGYEALKILVKAYEYNKVDLEKGILSVSYNGIAGKIDFTKKTCIGNYAKWELFQFFNGNAIKK